MSVDFWSPIRISLSIATVSCLIVFITGILAARKMARKNFRGKVFTETLLMLPLVLPPSVVGFILIILFGMNSPIGQAIQWVFQQPVIFTWWAGVIASSVVAFPLMYQSAKAGFLSVDHQVEEAARVDGAGEWIVFLLITVPLSFRSILSGTILSFTRALGEFGATLMFAGNIPGKTQTIPTAIYVAVDSGRMGMAWMWVVSMILISFGLLYLVYSRKQG